MAPTSQEKLKRALLLGFVAASVVLVGLIWAEGLGDGQPATPSYYRDTFQMNPDVYLTVTAEAVERQKELAGTPVPNQGTDVPHGDGQGRGQGQGQGQGAP
jgi:hypothetical protein